MAARAKFFVQSRVDHGHAVEITAAPVYSADPNSENRTFWTATPNGSLKLWIENKPAAEMFEQGKEFYLDFTPA